ncbi:MAG: hypothetical protein ACRELY_12380 [Polyangiaceae bacterium]
MKLAHLAGSKSRTRLCAIAAFFSTMALVACGGTADKKSGALTISFPSTNAAVASDKLELHVLDGSDPNACLNAVRARQAAPGTAPTATLYDIPATDTCEFLSNGVKPFDMGYGARAFLVVAQKGGSDFLIGCTLTGIGDISNQVNVDLTVFDKTTDVPQSTKCSSLSQKCAAPNSCF